MKTPYFLFFYSNDLSHILGFEGRQCTCPQGHVGNGVGPAGCVSQGPITGACGSAPCLNGGACQVSDIYMSPRSCW